VIGDMTPPLPPSTGRWSPGRRGRLPRFIVAVATLSSWTMALGAPLALLPRTAWADAERPANVVANEQAAGEPRATREPGPPGESGPQSESEEHTPAINGKSLALQLLNFGVLLAILIKFGGGAINKALASRHTQLKAELAAAAAARSQAEARVRKQEDRLAGLEREIAAMRVGIKQEAEVEKARLIAAAEERARRIREETTFVIEQQVKEAQDLLRRDVAASALRIAEEILRRAIDANDQRRMLDGFVDDVSGATDQLVEKAV
jgi:F-type H+-transporting ATPase subunit b